MIPFREPDDLPIVVCYSVDSAKIDIALAAFTLGSSRLVSRQLPLRSTATSRLYRPCRSSHSLHSLELRPAKDGRSLMSGTRRGLGLNAHSVFFRGPGDRSVHRALTRPYWDQINSAGADPRTRLIGNLGFDKFGQKNERFLPAQETRGKPSPAPPGTLDECGSYSLPWFTLADC